MGGRATVAFLVVGVCACGRLGFEPYRTGGTDGTDAAEGGDGAGGGDGSTMPGGALIVEGLGRGEGYASFVDPAGNSYIGGYFDGTTSFGGTTPYTSSGGFDGYIASYGPDNKLRWVTVLGGPGQEIVLSMKLGKGGDICTTGWYDMATSFGGAMLPSSGDQDVFVACFDSNGAHRWSVGTGGVGWDLGGGVAVDSVGNVYVSGTVRGRLAFGSPAVNVSGASDGFLSSFTSTGVHRWTLRLGGNGADTGGGIGIDAMDKIYVGGSFTNNASFGGATLTSAGGTDMFLAKYDAAGVHAWSRRDGGASAEQFWGMAVDPDGNSYMGIDFRTPSSTIGGVALATAGIADGVVASFDANGGFRWLSQMKSAGAMDAAAATAIAVAGTTVHVAVEVYGTVELAGTTHKTNGDDDIGLLRLDKAGARLDSASWGGTGADYAWSLAATSSGMSILTGMISDIVDFGTGPIGIAADYSHYWLHVPPPQ
jgi:hypothetical protein